MIDEMPKFYDYESPIERIVKEVAETMQEQEENGLVVAVSEKVGYLVDKDEMIKALKYDRDQYNKGYDAGTSALVKVLEILKREDKENYIPQELFDIRVVDDQDYFNGIRRAIQLIESAIGKW